MNIKAEPVLCEVIVKMKRPNTVNYKEAFKELLVKDRIRDLSKRSSYNVKLQAELTVQHLLTDGKPKSRDIDILVELFHSTRPKTAKYAFCIENKIKDGAINKGTNQLEVPYLCVGRLKKIGHPLFIGAAHILQKLPIMFLAVIREQYRL
ncbi:MAG: hypothetical protein K0S39_472 [Paenibacillus sp.]|jgi:hypothetical protein|nr:hypothetical protein [Paenibacillus sp.]